MIIEKELSQKKLNGDSNKDFSWIKIPKYKDDPTKSWEERYEDLKKHHIEETSFLIDTISLLKNQK